MLPSNLDARVSATNLKNEVSGKYSNQFDVLDKVSTPGKVQKERKKKRKVTFSDQLGHKQVKSNPSTPILIRLNSDEVSDDDDIIVKPHKLVQLPPAPSKVKPIKPKSTQEDEELVSAVKKLLLTSSKMSQPRFKFKANMAAAKYNFELLKQSDFDLHNLLNDTSNTSVTSYGSEFKHTSELNALFKKHHRWPELKTKLEKGSRWDLMAIEEDVRLDDLKASLQRGNHNSAKRNTTFVSDALRKEIEKGWELILPLEEAENIPGLVMSPMGVAEQIGVSESGTFVPKKRLTHDLSFSQEVSKEAINSRVIESDLEPCMFGHAFLRIIHKIVHLRKLFPNKKIWIRKEDAKSAYRRMHMSADTAIQAGVQLSIDNRDYLLISLRLPFGGSPCPSEFCLLSDMITDAVNDLMNCKIWNPKTIHSDYVNKIPPAKSLPIDIPFEKAKEMSVDLPDDELCKSDVFIDDIITVGVDTDDILDRIIAAPCTIMHAVAHKAENNETFVPRQDIISDDKNEAEGAPEEVKITLGWELDSRSLLVKLPSHKFTAWSSQVASFISRKAANAKDLSSVLGRLENVAIMIPSFGHFLNNIRQLEIKASITNKNQIINKRAKDDFELALKFLERARAGINMNLITFRVPNKIYINDASEHGLGGFATHGRAWTYNIPEKLRGRAHINLLEFLAQLISIWIDVLEHKIHPLDCLLGMGDNTASMGWLRRSNFRENDENDQEWLAKQKVARKLATLVLDSNASIYRQWFPGVENVVADSLSRDAYFLDSDTHQLLLNSTVKNQVPKDFKILPVPNEICCFVTSTLLLLPVQQHRLMRQKPSELALLNAGFLSSQKSASTESISKAFPSFSRTSSYPHSPKQYEKQPSLEQIEMKWWKEQSTPPSHMWLRPSGQTTGLTRDWTSTIRCASSYKSSFEHTETRTVLKRNKKHYQ